MMENVWEKLKDIKGRSWSETKNILDKVSKELGEEKPVKTYRVNAETLPEEDREIYGLYLKNEPFYLERCSICSRLLKPSVIDYHHDLHHRKNGTTILKKTTFISPNKKKYSKRSNKSTSEDDSESIISSETSSPTIDLTENNDSSASVPRDDLVDVISIDEIASEDSKPPTPGPQDLYEEFSVPCSEETSNSLSSIGESLDNIKSNSLLKLKIISNKDASQKLQTTSLLEAHLLSNTKYNTSSGVANIDLQLKPGNYRLAASSKTDAKNVVVLEQPLIKTEELSSDQTEPWKNSFIQQNSNGTASVLKTNTKISIPISVLPQNVKIVGSIKKQAAVPKASLKLLESKEKIDCGQPSSPFAIGESENTGLLLSSSDYTKEKSTSRSKKNKRSKNKNRAASRNVDFDPDKHCGVLMDENRHCMRSLTCKTHSISLRRNVSGRSKEFDKLLADHRASKEALKEPERYIGVSLCEPIINLPLLTADKLSGGTIQIASTNSEPEIIKIRVPNIVINADAPTKSHSDTEMPKSECDKMLKKLSSAKLSAGSKPSPATVHRVPPNTTNGEVKSQLYDNDIKISFVCSDMLYKVGGLLYTDRSRQAIRKCMLPLTTKGAAQKTALTKPPNRSRKITDFLQLVKSKASAPIKLNLLKENVDGVKHEDVKCDNAPIKLKTSEEIDRMRSVLVNSSKVLNSLSSDENELRKLRLTRSKRPADRYRNCAKKIKQECIADENYDINSLLSFDNRSAHDNAMSAVGADGFVYAFNANTNSIHREGTQLMEQPQHSNTTPLEHVQYSMGVHENAVAGNRAQNPNLAAAFAGNDSAQLWQTLRVLQNEMSTTAVMAPQVFASQPPELSIANEPYQSSYTDSGGLLAAAAPVFKENGEVEVIDGISNIEEAISKNYSLLEEYCKNITTDELLLDGKGNFEFYENNVAPLHAAPGMKLSRNLATQVAAANAAVGTMYAGGVASVAAGNDGAVISVPDAGDDLTFDARVLTSYLSSISGDTAVAAAQGAASAVNDVNFVRDQFNVVQMEPSMAPPILARDAVYEKMLTLNKQFPDSTAVKIEKPPTPTPTVYTEAANEEVLKWLF